MNQITNKHLEFLDECRKVFNNEILRTTHINEDGDLIALRYGADRDCIEMLELGQEIAFFAQILKPTDADEFIQEVGKFYDRDVCEIRDELGWFVEKMEAQLRANEHKGGWKNTANHHLLRELDKNLHKLMTCASHSEYRRRCANIANFAMILADNDQREEAERS